MVIKEIQEKVDWVNYMDAEAMKTMIKTSEDVFAITNEEPVILPNSSCLLWGPLIIGLRLGLTKMWARKCVMQVPMYFSTFLIR